LGIWSFQVKYVHLNVILIGNEFILHQYEMITIDILIVENTISFNIPMVTIIIFMDTKLNVSLNVVLNQYTEMDKMLS